MITPFKVLYNFKSDLLKPWTPFVLKIPLILNELGYQAKGYQENRRVQYSYKNCEIDIDYWPKIPTYLEIEGPTEESVYEVLKDLGFEKKDSTTRDVEGIYLDYGHNLQEIYDLKLEEERKWHYMKI